MLRAKDGSTRRGLRQTLQWSAIAILVVAAAGTTALRGLAEPPDKEADGSVRVARATDVKPKLANVEADAHVAAAALFQRPAFDPSAVAGKNGGFIVRLGEILKRDGFAEQSRQLHKSYAIFFQDLFPDAEAPVWSLEDIDYIAGDLMFNVRPAPKPTTEHPNELGVGARSFVIRWNKPLDGQFEAMLRIPGATEKSHEGTVYVELPIIPAIGTTKMRVCRLDDHSLLASQNEKWFLSRLSVVRGPGESKTWQKAWKDVDGGLLALVSTDASIERPFGDPGNEETKLFNDLFSQTRGYAIGVDWQENAGGASVVKGQFRFDTAEDADRFKNAIRTWTDKGANFVRAEEAKVDKEGTEKAKKANKQIKAMLEALQQAKIETRQDGEGWLIDMQIAGPFDYRPLLEE